jgi:hypothetical protein
MPNKLAAARTGIAKKNETLAESNLSKPNSLPEVIVMPDLLTPGIKDNILNKPIIIDYLFLNLIFIFFVNFI